MNARVIDPSPYPPKGWRKITDVRFDSELHLRRLTCRPPKNPNAQAVLSSPFSISYSLDGGSMTGLTVPTDFITDGTSYAGFVGTTRWGPELEASVVHDYLYVVWYYLKGKDQRKPKKRYRKFADDLFLELLLTSGSKSADAKRMHWWCRTLGWVAFVEQNPNAWCA